MKHLEPHYWVHWFNYAVPLPRGRWFLQRVARRLGDVPEELIDVKIDHGLLMDLDLRDWVDMCVYFNLMDPEIKQAINDFVDEGDTVLDIGANIGYFSLLMAKRVGPQGSVHSFEPHPSACRKLRTNMSRNQLEDVVNIHCSAVADKQGVIDLYTYDGHSGLSSIAPYPGRVSTPVDTLVETLDALFQSNIIGDPNFIKIDVEGADLLVLKGAEELVGSIRPVIVAEIGHCELFGYSARDIRRWAEAHDYEYLLMDPLSGYREATVERIDELVPGEHYNVLLRPR